MDLTREAFVRGNQTVLPTEPIPHSSVELSESHVLAPPSHVYQAYGLRLRSDRALPGVPPATDGSETDLSVRFLERWSDELPVSAEDEWIPVSAPDIGRRVGHQIWTLRASGLTYYRLRLRYVHDECFGEFVIDQTGSRVWAVWGDTVTLRDVIASLLGPVLGCVLRLRGVTCLHASVVAIGDRAVAIAGRKESGKSTLAAALARNGIAVLADDIAVLAEREARFVVQPGYRRLRLKPSSIRALYGAEDGLSPVRSFDTKRYLELTSDRQASRWRFGTEPLPLAAIYVLTRCDPSTTEPRIRAMGRAEGLIAVLANTYVDYMVSPALRAREFARLGLLTGRVPVRELQRPDGLATLPDLCALICDDSERLR
jgi:hypothetical protein